MEKIYLDQLDINYFKECIQEVLDHYTVENVGKVKALDRLEKLDIQVSGLRDAFYLFSIDDIVELKQPIEKQIEFISRDLDKSEP